MSDKEGNLNVESEAEEEEDGEWEDWESGGDGEGEPAKSLFCNNVLDNPESAMDFDAENHNFDIRKFAIKHRLDEYDIFRCINWIRSEVKAGRTPAPAAIGDAVSAWRGNDDFLVPVMDDDALLFYDYEDVVAAWRLGNCNAGVNVTPTLE